ncbi:MAG TPA: hypothetical protein ENI23_06600 [bacterium]|nr:hypothetical protein [bacterium]
MPRIYTTGKKCKSYKHGMRHTRFYRIWLGMKSRCLIPSASNYKHYGGRGITICKRWYKFMNFHEDMYGKYNDDLSIERIDNEKGYNRFNCKWILMKDQQHNTRRSHRITFEGKTQTIKQWANELGLHYQTLYGRICNYGFSLEKAMVSTKYATGPKLNN